MLCSFSLGALEGIPLKDKKELDKYKFVLLMPKDDVSYLCAVFSLDSLRVCRFPNGPMWSNSINSHKLYTISNAEYSQITKYSDPLPVLCMDEGRLDRDMISRSNKNLCGFALPWELGMAFVFDDLKEVSRVSGVIIDKTYLQKINLPLTRSIAFSDYEEDDGLDEIDLLIAGNEDEEFDARVLPYPLENIKNVLGKIFINCLIKYHAIRLKLQALLKVKNA